MGKKALGLHSHTCDQARQQKHLLTERTCTQGRLQTRRATSLDMEGWTGMDILPFRLPAVSTVHTQHFLPTWKLAARTTALATGHLHPA